MLKTNILIVYCIFVANNQINPYSVSSTNTTGKLQAFALGQELGTFDKEITILVALIAGQIVRSAIFLFMDLLHDKENDIRFRDHVAKNNTIIGKIICTNSHFGEEHVWGLGELELTN